MKLITERQKIRGVAEAWRAQYCQPYRVRFSDSDEKDEKLSRLLALDVETATAADVAAIIGNTTWAGPERCQECEQTCAVVVQLGEEPDYESNTAWVCVECLRKALALAEKGDA